MSFDSKLSAVMITPSDVEDNGMICWIKFTVSSCIIYKFVLM